MSHDTAKPPLAILIVAHGERGGDFSNAILQRHENVVRAAMPMLPVAAGVLSGEPSLETAAAAVAARTNGPILVYPFFMAAGYFVNVKIPKRLADAGLTPRCRILTPLGAAPRLPALIRDRAGAAAQSLGVSAGNCRLLLVGHGSKVARASAEATELAAARLRELGGFATVATAFLEEAPFLGDVVASDDRPTVVVGFFNGDGLHAAEDVPEAIANFDGKIAYTGPVGAFAEVSSLIAATIADAVHDTRPVTEGA